MSSQLFAPGTVIDSPWLNDVDTATYNRLTAVAGTNTITATGPTSMASVTAGDRFFFSPAVTNTGAATININSLGVQPIVKYGVTNLSAGDLVFGVMALIVYDGSLFQLINPQTFNTAHVVPVASGGTGAITAAQALINLGATGRLLNVQVFGASGTYTPTVGTTKVIVECVGGGGAGGGANATPVGEVSAGSGGGSGAHTLAWLTHSTSVAITVGAGGVGVSAAAGGNGGTSSFGALVTAPGGGGGARNISSPTWIIQGGGLGAAVGTGGNLYAAPGTEGGFLNGVQPVMASGTGAAGPFGGGAGIVAGANGKPGLGIGSGGSGAANSQNDANLRIGGNGAAGVVIVYEYS